MNLTVRLMVVAVVLTAAGCATRAPVYAPGANVTSPVVVTKKNPDYTEEAMRAKIQGIVRLDCVVLPSLDSVHGLDGQATLALQQWTFEPGLKDGVPVPVRVTVQMSFTLD